MKIHTNFLTCLISEISITYVYCCSKLNQQSIEPRFLEVEDTGQKYSTYPRFDSPDVECVVIYFECTIRYGICIN